MLATYLGHARYTDTAPIISPAQRNYWAWQSRSAAVTGGGAKMSAHSSLPPLLESFFATVLTKQRNASLSTIASYRDDLRMLILFAADSGRA